ncbi:MAG: SPASM domain-containing protein [Anaerolineaceae bacterium]|nr:SPASM domain-containing protein [Anaerolineaceae bacterium]
MKKPEILRIDLDENGHLVIPAEVAAEYGLTDGALVRLQHSEGGFRLTRSTASLVRVYIEITNLCNLNCSTCMRNVWDEPMGSMDMLTFEKILAGIKGLDPLPTVFIGGFGEPLAHPQFLEMVAAARKLGAQVEFITNGILLSEEIVKTLVDLNVQRVWVSIDGATPSSYADVRLGDELPLVTENLYQMQRVKVNKARSRPRLGIAFVAMKKNIQDLPDVIRLGKNVGADKFSVSNLLPHTAPQKKEILYARSMDDMELQPSRWSPEVILPRMDLNALTIEVIDRVMKSNNLLNLARQPLKMAVDSCPFLEKGSVSIRWDGAISPCLPLLHTHQSFLDDTLRINHAHSFGNIHAAGLLDIWQSPAYVQFREKLQAFDFSFCTYCNSCDMAESNLEDCFGNDHPTCGGCLWAQGFIQCP